MKSVGLICEFNPLHDGHKYIISRSKEEGDILICVMSGNFCQRGEAAVFDKYKRAKAAADAGADIVLELPFPFSSSSGEYFASSGVNLLNSVGVCKIVFGSESGDISLLTRASVVKDSEEFSKYFKSLPISNGISHNYDEAMKHFGITLLSNDKLGSEYVRIINKEKFAIEPIAIKMLCGISHSSEIREKLYNNSLADVDKHTLTEYEYRNILLSDTDNDSFECGNGVFGFLKKSAEESDGPEDFKKRINNKTYTDSRLQRALLFNLLKVKSSALDYPPHYSVILALSRKGRDYLSKYEKTFGVELLTKPSKAPSGEIPKEQYRLSSLADRLYAMCRKEKVLPSFYLTRSPYIKE